MENCYELVSAMDACADRLDVLNGLFPELATPNTLAGVIQWRQRRLAMADQNFLDNAKREPQAGIDVRSVAVNLLRQNSLEDVLDLLAEQHSVALSLHELVQIIGKKEYLVVLRREFNELLKNAISFEQIATLWNDLERPAFGGPNWNSRSISMLAG
ncbi:MAG: hypothetical protein H6964_14565 [Chromatiaceae bacterium]|nr:hypothetical protein [Gammaproteobacteria bacterium]MCP5448199.1 hypothetical protein [Chromatiaceae bacterium]MCB1862148.1 hypothetical protein [Gammaproteobacteria bacterium]MCB1870774.1 hypothetical protein [Gammaproteobacteria bacterium]MCB1878548.1 hypothetical protein [Gammaproteobacteria bacterium]